MKDGDRLTVRPYMLVLEIAAAGSPYTPLLQIDVSGNAAQQTMPAPRRA